MVNAVNLSDTQVVIQVIYSDINATVISISPNDIVTNEDSILQAVVTLFTTRVKTRPFRRRYGAIFASYIFDQITQRTADRIAHEIPDILLEWEPRIQLLVHRVLPDYINQQYYIELQVLIPALGNRMVTYKFNIGKG